jgi:NAD-dependent SIR2 family protein deacetylase
MSLEGSSAAAANQHDSGVDQWHGRLGIDKEWAKPVRTAHCSILSRPEYTTIQGHEYRDTPAVLNQKVSLLASLIKESKACVAYTGAGLSVASGLADYATKAKERIASRPSVSKERGSGFLAQPNVGHRVLADLHHAGFLKAVVNQNHDGLLQKAGFPQHAVNEIHGSWFDPSNPGGNILRDDLFQNLLSWEKTTDLCLALGTSLSGLNADRLATTPAKKFPKSGFGLVIITLQATQLDEQSTLRIFAPLDDVLMMLAKELNLPNASLREQQQEASASSSIAENPGRDVFRVRYDPDSGEISDTKSCVLDLREGAKIKILRGTFEGSTGVVGKKNTQGHYALQIFQTVKVDGLPDVTITDEHLLGAWWVHEALAATARFIPVVND